jgi:hypothetical protein
MKRWLVDQLKYREGIVRGRWVVVVGVEAGRGCQRRKMATKMTVGLALCSRPSELIFSLTLAAALLSGLG